MIGLTSLRPSMMPPEPCFDAKRAAEVIAEIDRILAWQQRLEKERDRRFVELGRYLCEVRAKQYWRVQNLASFDDFLEKRFPGSRRKAYYFMAIHEQLPRPMHASLEQIGWSKAKELTRMVRHEGPNFNASRWLDQAQQLSSEELKQAVEKAITGESEAYEILYFKIYKSQLQVIEQAIEMAARLLGSDYSRGYCLEMICADFLAGVHAADDEPQMLVTALDRVFRLMSAEHQLAFVRRLASAITEDGPDEIRTLGSASV